MEQLVQASPAEDLANTLRVAFQRAFERTEAIFNLIKPEAYKLRPIQLRHPPIFYEGHLAVFIWNTLFRRILDKAPLNPDFEVLFERGIDPASLDAARLQRIDNWPPLEAIRAYREAVHYHLFHFLDTVDFERPTHPLLKNGYALFLVLEHELMHQETLMYLFHQLPYALKQMPSQWNISSHSTSSATPTNAAKLPGSLMVEIPAGMAYLGTSLDQVDFAWDNELPSLKVEVGPFAMDVWKVSNGQFLEFMEAGGYQERRYWTAESWAWKENRGHVKPAFWRKDASGWRLNHFFEEIALPLNWPVYVTYAEAEAYARYIGKSLPSEAEWHRAAYGDQQEYRYPWGDGLPTVEHGNFDFQGYAPRSVDQSPLGASVYGVQELVGNGWEWTCTQFGPLPGFEASEAYPQYSRDFFDGLHYVVKGGSCFTDQRLLRPSFRNWYYWHYPYAYTSFRCVIRR